MDLAAAGVDAVRRIMLEHGIEHEGTGAAQATTSGDARDATPGGAPAATSGDAPAATTGAAPAAPQSSPTVA